MASIDAKSLESAFDENKATKATDKYSRSAAAVGFDVIKNLFSLRVLVVGLQGVGVETAKNIILAGCKGVTVWDPTPAVIQDLGTNFYLKESDIGSPRATVCLKELSQLNPDVEVRSHDGDLDEKFLANFGAVIVTIPMAKPELFRINKACRERTQPALFILALNLGVTSTIFTDFGDKHIIKDRNGEPVMSLTVSTADSTGCIQFVQNHSFDDGEVISISDFGDAWGALNGVEGIKVKRVYESYTAVDVRSDGTKVERKARRLVRNKIVLDLSDTKVDLASLGEYTSGGIVTQIKPTSEVNFRSLEDALVKPTHSFMDDYYGIKCVDQGACAAGKGSQVFFFFSAVLEFFTTEKRLPKLHCTKDASKIADMAAAISEENKKTEGGHSKEVDKKFVRTLALYAGAELTGFCAFLGGVAGQEITKIWGKYTPIHQWICDFQDELVQPEPPADAVTRGTRYDYQIAVFGQALHEKILNQTWFLVGCGALGCEYIKAFALMGIGAGPRGRLILTDMDNIELSNLTRQFLFRKQHIGKAKSVCAAAVAQEMNPDLNPLVFETRVAPDTEHVFTTEFWRGLDGIWNALDNVKARTYTDGRAALFGLPLLESGTQGPAANVQVILPYKTPTYSDHKDVDTGRIAACTLKNFPFKIEHCIEWARPLFDDTFERLPVLFNKFLSDPAKFIASVEKSTEPKEKLEKLNLVKALWDHSVKPSFEGALASAFELYYLKFNFNIVDLTRTFPKDARNKKKTESGEELDLGPFWTGSKRFPRFAEFSAENKLHFSFLYNTTNLFLVMMGLEPVRDEAEFLAKFKKAAPTKPEHVASAVEDLDDDEKKAAAGGDDPFAAEKAAEKKAAALLEWVKGLDTKTAKELVVADFEKDDDTNFHIDFIAASSNLRAWNYQMKLASRHKVKVIAGKILAALATTTAMIAGLTAIEFYKVVMGLQYSREDRFKNALINLATSEFNYFAPGAPARSEFKSEEISSREDGIATCVREVTKPAPYAFSRWDTVKIEAKGKTVGELVALIEKTTGYKVNSLEKYDLSTSEADETTPLFFNTGYSEKNLKKYEKKRDKAKSDRLKTQYGEFVAEELKKKEILETQSLPLVADAYKAHYGELKDPTQDFILLQVVCDAPKELIEEYDDDKYDDVNITIVCPRFQVFI